jgi:hypothetical protein
MHWHNDIPRAAHSSNPRTRARTKRLRKKLIARDRVIKRQIWELGIDDSIVCIGHVWEIIVTGK